MEQGLGVAWAAARTPVPSPVAGGWLGPGALGALGVLGDPGEELSPEL